MRRIGSGLGLSRRRAASRRPATRLSLERLEERTLLSLAVFLGEDKTTQGNWIGKYGSQGYDVIGDPASLPSSDVITPSGYYSTYNWAPGTTDPRALQNPGGSGRNADTWYANPTFNVSVDLGDGQAHDLELYFLDYYNGGRSEQVQISDATTGDVLSTQTVSSFGSGVYLDYAVSGNLTITITLEAGQNVLLSGLFLDPVTTAEPVVTGEAPAVGSTAAPTKTAVTATFNEAVQPSTINFTLAGSNGTAVPATVSYNSSSFVATLTPNAPLANSTTYTATISGATDSKGHTMTAPVVWSFTTGPAPAVIAETPAPQATGLAIGTPVTATFNEAVQPGTIKFTLASSNGTAVPATVSYNPSNLEVTLTPNAPLAYGMTYTATITGVKDPAGDPMSGGTVSWSFTDTSYIQLDYNTIPDFGEFPTAISIASGSWSNPATWSTGQVPGAGAIVSIAPGTTVTYDANSTTVLNTIVVQSGGTFQFATNVNTEVIADNYLVMQGGTLDVGTQANPIAPNVTATIETANQALNTTFDPEQYGDSLIGLGNVTMYGAYKTPFAQLATAPLAGATTLTFSSPVTGWQVGDKLFLPDTRQLDYNQHGSDYVSEAEYATISSIASNGLSVTLTSPLLYNHLGAYNDDGVLQYLPQVADETRNVTVRSQSGGGVRGVAMFLDQADVNLNSVDFLALGRTTDAPIDNTTFNSNGQVTSIGTNEGDRSPVTFLNLWGPTTPQPDGYQYTFADNVVNCPMTPQFHIWGIEVNNSSYGLIEGNVVDNWYGAGIALVSGTEVGNMISGNFVTQTSGTGQRTTSGLDGVAYWSRSPDDSFVNNVATDTNQGGDYSYGFGINASVLGTVNVPAYQGADPALPAQSVAVDMNGTPLLAFSGNEVYGATPNGLELWDLGSDYRTPEGTGGTVLNFVVWHQWNWGYFGYESNDLTIDGFVDLGDMTGDVTTWPADGMWFSDYMQQGLVIENADIQGQYVGIEMPVVANGTTTLENSYLANQTNVLISTMGSANGPVLPALEDVIDNVQFVAPPGHPYYAAISMSYSPVNGNDLIQSDQCFVYNYNGVSGDNFQVYYDQQVASFVVPQSSSTGIGMIGSPVSGLTNQQNWATYGICIAGSIAPSNATTMAYIDGLVVSLASSASSDALIATTSASGSAVSASGAMASVSGLPASPAAETLLQAGDDGPASTAGLPGGSPSGPTASSGAVQSLKSAGVGALSGPVVVSIPVRKQVLQSGPARLVSSGSPGLGLS